MAVREAALLPLEEFGFQICRGCGAKKRLGEFSPNKSMRLGIQRTCKPCNAKWARAWVKKNPERAFDAHLRRRFGGFTLEQYNAMLAEQGGVCRICGALPTDPRNRRKGNQRVFIARLVVDHDHATGKVRGLLCHSCNAGIGLLKDDAATVHAALEYLKRT